MPLNMLIVYVAYTIKEKSKEVNSCFMGYIAYCSVLDIFINKVLFCTFAMCNLDFEYSTLYS